VGAHGWPALIGPHRVERGNFVIEHPARAFTLMIIGRFAPVAALLLAAPRPARISLRKTGGFGASAEPAFATAGTGFSSPSKAAMRGQVHRSTRWPNGFVARARGGGHRDRRTPIGHGAGHPCWMFPPVASPTSRALLYAATSEHVSSCRRSGAGEW